MSPIQEGSLIRGKYRVERVLGEGGMGVVVTAWHLQLEQRVAIKVLQPELLQYLEFVERFLREARAASRLEGDHVVRVTDVDTLDSGAPFMVMEYLDGADLSSVRRSGRPLPFPEAVGHVIEACQGVAEAHALGIIHRDLKPANLFLAKRRDGSSRVKVLDFGISKMTGPPGASDVGITSTTAVMGSAEYMSPEQMMSTKDVDARTDIWALGVILYELCTAQVPFPGETITQVCARVMSVEPMPPRAIRADLPAGLEAVILRCLRRNRDERFASVRELMAALAPFGRQGAGAAIADTRSSPSFAAASSPGHVIGSGTVPVLGVQVTQPRKRSMWPLVAGGAALLLVGIGAGAFLWWSGEDDGPPPIRSAAPARTAAPAPNPADPGDAPAATGTSPGNRGGAPCRADEVDTTCKATLFVQLATVPSSTPETHDFPQTRELLRESPDFAGIKLVEANYKGYRVLAAIVKNRCQGDKLVALQQEKMKSGAIVRCETIEERRVVTVVR